MKTFRYQLTPDPEVQEIKRIQGYAVKSNKASETEHFYCPDSVAGLFTFPAELKRTHATFRIPAPAQTTHAQA